MCGGWTLRDVASWFALLRVKPPQHHALRLPQVGGKLRLQLMPLDGPTAQAMAAAGHHPFLELTLSTTKSLLGVLRHLGTKWQAAAAAAAGGRGGASALYVHPPSDCPITLRGVCWGGPDCDSQLKVGTWGLGQGCAGAVLERCNFAHAHF